MLAALALFDSLYILLSLWEAMRREMNTTDFFAYAVRYVTYPLQNIVLCITIFLPVALAFERYRAIRYVINKGQSIKAKKATKIWRNLPSFSLMQKFVDFVTFFVTFFLNFNLQ